MLQLSDYQVFIFDCDGVILDSNELKITAMRQVLSECFSDTVAVTACIDYFKNNFGKSRFHHIGAFVTKILDIPKNSINDKYELILKLYSEKCEALYLKADITPGFIDFIKTLQGNLYIASGSEEKELRSVFEQRGLDCWFNGIYGSPTPKQDIVESIMSQNPSKRCVFFGDALSDMNAAEVNNIDFIAYLPFSNVQGALKEESMSKGFSCIKSWESI